jgi:carbon-monoxide dehydrogenase medium subunit
MRRFEYFEPTTLGEAIDLLGEYGRQASILAGGTDLLVEIKERIRSPDHVVNIKRIPGLDHLTYTENDGLRIGALVTVRSVEISPIVREKYAGLAQAAKELGSIQIRNRATVAGNICRASPSADTLPPLIADASTVILCGPDGERTVLLEEFCTGPGKTVLSSDEVLVEISVPSPEPHTGKAYVKHGRRKAMELATVGVAVTIKLDGDVCREARIVLGAVAPTPIRATRAEELLCGTVIDDAAIHEAAELAMAASKPISDVRSSAEYRREMVRVLTGRAIRQAFDRASAPQ